MEGAAPSIAAALTVKAAKARRERERQRMPEGIELVFMSCRLEKFEASHSMKSILTDS
jgi:hypothetical protein